MTHTYDEIRLKDSLSRLSRPKVIAFAAAAATRQTRNYESFAATVSSGALARYHEIVNLLWANASTQALDQSVWSELVDEITSYLDDVEATAEKQWLYAAPAEDALASLAYAIRYILDPNPQEAEWAARRAYEISDQVAIAKLGMDPLRELESLILADAIVQRELGRQIRDLGLLEQSDTQLALVAVEALARAEPLLTDEEIQMIPQWQAAR
jgi:uncharacterized protein YjaG (DUF416 family)